MKKIMFITKKKIRKEIYRRYNDSSVEIIEMAYKWGFRCSILAMEHPIMVRLQCDLGKYGRFKPSL